MEKNLETVALVVGLLISAVLWACGEPIMAIALFLIDAMGWILIWLLSSISEY